MRVHDAAVVQLLQQHARAALARVRQADAVVVQLVLTEGAVGKGCAEGRRGIGREEAGQRRGGAAASAALPATLRACAVSFSLPRGLCLFVGVLFGSALLPLLPLLPLLMTRPLLPQPDSSPSHLDDPDREQPQHSLHGHDQQPHGGKRLRVQRQLVQHLLGLGLG